MTFVHSGISYVVTKAFLYMIWGMTFIWPYLCLSGHIYLHFT